MERLTPAKKVGFSLVLLILFWGLTELACWAGLWALQRYKNLEYKPAEITDLEPKNRASIEGHLSDPETYLVVDCDSSNGVFVNGERVGGRRRQFSAAPNRSPDLLDLLPGQHHSCRLVTSAACRLQTRHEHWQQCDRDALREHHRDQEFDQSETRSGPRTLAHDADRCNFRSARNDGK